MGCAASISVAAGSAAQAVSQQKFTNGVGHSARASGELSRYFGGPYLEGRLYEGHAYEESYFDGHQTFCYNAPDGVVQVWQHALHLGGPEAESGSMTVLYHYTNEFCFRNVVNMEQMSSQLFASLTDQRAHFGYGVYATQWQSSRYIK